jgi:integrase
MFRGTFHSWLTNRGYSPRTIELYTHYVRRCTKHLKEAGRSLNRADHADLYLWWTTLPMSASSRNGARHALIAYYRYRGRDDGAPAHKIPRTPAPTTLPRPVAAVTYDAIRDAADQLGGIHRILGALLADTGCRIGEARRARWHQFELRGDEPTWHIEGKWSRRRGPKIRAVPVNAHLRGALTAWRAECTSADWLFPSIKSRTGYLAFSTLGRHLEEVCEMAGAERITAHRWRHSVATIALELTGDIRGVQELLGHASLATTQIYTQVSTRRLRAVTDVLDGPHLFPPAA